LEKQVANSQTNQNPMYFKFEKLIIWQRAMTFGEKINEISLKFPQRERYNLSDQILRAADSIALNISEGSISQSHPEFRKFIGYSIRSLAEVVTCNHKAKKRAYITDIVFNEMYLEAYNLMNMMVAFKRNIR
jgi:four helix bundle protein